MLPQMIYRIFIVRYITQWRDSVLDQSNLWNCPVLFFWVFLNMISECQFLPDELLSDLANFPRGKLWELPKPSVVAPRSMVIFRDKFPWQARVWTVPHGNYSTSRYFNSCTLAKFSLIGSRTHELKFSVNFLPYTQANKTSQGKKIARLTRGRLHQAILLHWLMLSSK
jgi:hypothetical protein